MESRSILLFFPHNPFLLQNGVQTRFFSLLGYFRSRGFSVDLLTHQGFVDTWEPLPARLHEFVRNIYMNDFKSSRVQTPKSSKVLPDFAFEPLKMQLEELVLRNRYDDLIIAYVHWAGIVQDVHKVRKIIMIEDFISLNMFERLKGAYDFGASVNDEVSRIALFDEAICISRREQEFFERLCPNVTFRYVPHFIESIKEQKRVKKRYDIAFVGSDNPFNEQAMRWYLEEIHPLLGDAFRMAIVGGVNLHLQRYHGRLGVEFIPYVEDVHQLYRASRVVICPMLGGTGLKIKLVEALSAGTPVVATRFGLLDMAGTQNGCIEANDADSFARAITSLLHDRKLYHRLCKEAQAFFRAHFSSDTAYERLDRIFGESQ